MSGAGSRRAVSHALSAGPASFAEPARQDPSGPQDVSTALHSVL